jgi:putative flippase GtrA
MKLSSSLLKFGAVGIIGLAVDLAVLAALRDALGVYGARAVSFLAAATATWLLNRHFTFSSRSAELSLWREYAHYMGLMLGGGLINIGTYSLLAWQFSQAPLWLAVYTCAGSLAGMTMNFLGASQWLYRHKKNP